MSEHWVELRVWSIWSAAPDGSQNVDNVNAQAFDLGEHLIRRYG